MKLSEEEAVSHFKLLIGINDRADILKYFIEELKLNFKSIINNENGDSILHFAVTFGAKKCLESLLGIGKYNINTTNGSDATPLTYACFYEDIINLLVQKGAKIDQQTIEVFTRSSYSYDEGKEVIESFI
ncbi:ankyrin repeat domain-containing protein [Rickettsia helvetica]|uniref:ankyrin repeat domain-containing protein n=1 Tax=Rickettsia helvetica TaxID=35789 RepID=UPI000A00FBB5